MRHVLSSDPMHGMRDKMREAEALLKEWEDVTGSTDRDDAKQHV